MAPKINGVSQQALLLYLQNLQMVIIFDDLVKVVLGLTPSSEITVFYIKNVPTPIRQLVLTSDDNHVAFLIYYLLHNDDR